MSKGKIPIGEARSLSRRFQMPMVLIFGISPDGGQFHLTTYGATKALCKLAGSFADQIADKIFGAEIAPPDGEPENQPSEPIQTTGERKKS